MMAMRHYGVVVRALLLLLLALVLLSLLVGISGVSVRNGLQRQPSKRGLMSTWTMQKLRLQRQPYFVQGLRLQRMK